MDKTEKTADEIISIPTGTIKRLILQQTMSAVQKFQFLLVRLKAVYHHGNRYLYSLFQFLLVRLKVGMNCIRPTAIDLFQFLLVRLKALLKY